MDVAFLLDKYFKDGKNVSVDVFDAHTLNAVYKDVITAMTAHLEIEVSVLQALSYFMSTNHVTSKNTRGQSPCDSPDGTPAKI